MSMTLQHDTIVRPSTPVTHPAGPHKFTFDEYATLADLGIISGRTELVGGEITHMAPVGNGHSVALQDLYDLLRQIFPNPRFIRTQATFKMGSHLAREPDISVLRTRPSLAEPFDPQVPELVVEVAFSSLEVDLGEKRLEYAHKGVAEYWVVDLKRRAVHVFRQPVSDAHVADAAYGQVAIVDRDGTLSPLAAPHAVIAVADFMPLVGE